MSACLNSTAADQGSLLSRRAYGFTTIELVVVLAILAVFAALAAPSFTPLLERWRVRQATESLQSTLHLARSEAFVRGKSIAIIKLANGNGCVNAASDSQWGCGWRIFIDANGNNTQDTGEEVLREIEAPTRVEIDVGASIGAGTMKSVITVDRWGQFSNNGIQTLVFRLKPQGKPNTDVAAAAVCISAGGNIKRLKTGNGTC